MQNYMIKKMNYRTNSNILEGKSYASLYNCSIGLVQVSNSKGHKYIFKQDNKLYIHVDKLIKRREFVIRIWNQSIDNYYSIVEDIGTQRFTELLSSNLGGSQQTWRSFGDRGLFSTAFKERNLLSYKVNKKLWRFYRFTQQYIRNNK